MKKLILLLSMLLMIMGCSHQKESYLKMNIKKSNDEWIFDVDMARVKCYSMELCCYEKGEIVNIIPLAGLIYGKDVNDKGKVSLKYYQSASHKPVPLLHIDTEIFNVSGNTKILTTDTDFTKQIAILDREEVNIIDDKEMTLMTFVDDDSYQKKITEVEKAIKGYKLTINVEFY